MIKVAATPECRPGLVHLVDVFRARIIDLAPDSLTIEITGAEDKIDGLLEVLKPYGVLEMARTGPRRNGARRASRRTGRGRRPGVQNAIRFQRFLLGLKERDAAPASSRPAGLAAQTLKPALYLRSSQLRIPVQLRSAR